MNPKLDNWTQQRVWLIGASSGIGAALAQELARRGARLALSARHADKLAALGISDARILSFDATDAASMAAAHEELLAAWGAIDQVIYLAGDYVPMRADTFDIALADKVIAVNLHGAMHLAATVLPALYPGSGITFVASVAGYRGLPKALAYGPGKAALINFAECLYLDLAPRGIAVRVVNPGFVATALTAKNDFSMPALITPQQAANALLTGFARGDFEIHFPRRFTRVMKLLEILPYRWYFFLVRRMTGG